MSFTAKAVVTNVMDNTNDTVTLSFGADYEGNTINQEWAKYTPWLHFELNVTSEFAQKLQAGQKFTVTFTEDE